MGTLFLRFWHFIRLTKIAKNAIFQFSTRFLKTFPSTHLGPQYLKKNPKPSSTRIYPKQPRWPTHGQAVALAKYDQCGGTVGKFLKNIRTLYSQKFGKTYPGLLMKVSHVKNKNSDATQKKVRK